MDKFFEKVVRTIARTVNWNTPKKLNLKYTHTHTHTHTHTEPQAQGASAVRKK